MCPALVKSLLHIQVSGGIYFLSYTYIGYTLDFHEIIDLVTLYINV